MGQHSVTLVVGVPVQPRHRLVGFTRLASAATVPPVAGQGDVDDVRPQPARRDGRDGRDGGVRPGHEGYAHLARVLTSTGACWLPSRCPSSRLARASCGSPLVGSSTTSAGSAGRPDVLSEGDVRHRQRVGRRRWGRFRLEDGGEPLKLPPPQGQRGAAHHDATVIDQDFDGAVVPAGPDLARERRGWYAYDWASSAFSATVVTVFLGPYLTEVANRAADGSSRIHPLGIPVDPDSLFPYAVSLSVALQVFVLPLTGAVADRMQHKKRLLAVLAYIGSLSTMSMFFVSGRHYGLGAGLFVVANVALGASIVVYNSYLPQISTPQDRDATSSRGWAAGYLGGGMLLALNLVLFEGHASFGVSEAVAVRISLSSAGAWWALFSIPTVRWLRDRRDATAPRGGNDAVTAATPLVRASARQLAQTVRGARAYPQTLLFLAAYLLYNDAIQTVIALSAQYGKEELGLSQSTLIASILIVQFVAFGGALLLGVLAVRLGAKRVVMASLGVWVAVIGYGFVLPRENPVQFFLLAICIGIVLGGSQAISRSLFSQMIPRGREAEYFGLYEISERGTSWLGPLVFGVVKQLSGSYRLAILSLVVFFVAGACVLARVDVRRAVAAAGNATPNSR